MKQLADVLCQDIYDSKVEKPPEHIKNRQTLRRYENISDEVVRYVFRK